MTDKTAKASAAKAPEQLLFEDDAGASRSIWIAGALVIASVGWMGSGFIFPAIAVTGSRRKL